MKTKNASRPDAPAPIADVTSKTGEVLAHRFTESQQKQVDAIFSAMADLESKAQFFFNYVISEAGLTVPAGETGGFSLSASRRGLVRAA